MEFPFKRPPWLRWQTARLSPWLNIFIVVGAVVSILVPILTEQHQLGSDFGTAFFVRMNRLETEGPTTYDYVVWAATSLFGGSHICRTARGLKKVISSMCF